MYTTKPIAKKKLVKNNTNVVNINYHIIFCPKYRRKVLINGADKRLKEILYEYAPKWDFQIKSIEVMPDHVHLFISSTPELSVRNLVAKIKGITSHVLRSEMEWLRRRIPTLWTRSYYCETVGCVSEDAIRKYIENQKKR